MSCVTNVILTFSVLEDDEERIKDVNKFFENGTTIVSCDDNKLERGWYGGTKMLETNVCIGAYNYLPLESFKNHIKKIKWDYSEDVQLIVQEQDESRFRLYNFESLEV